MMRARTKLVNGIRVYLTSKQIRDTEAEWAIEDAKPPEPPPRDMFTELDNLEARIKQLETRER